LTARNKQEGFTPEMATTQANDDVEEFGIHIISGEINSQVAKDAVESMVKIENSKTADHILLVVNSEGGDMCAGFFITDWMDICGIPVYTLGTGQVMSAGLLVVMAGCHGKRFLSPSSLILSHRFWDSKIGSHAELVSARRGEDIAHQMCVEHYIKHSKYRTEKQVEKHLLQKTDKWLTPFEAVAHGLADEIINTMEDAK